MIRDLDADRRDRHAKLVDILHRVRTRTLLRDVRRTAAGPMGDARQHRWNETLDRRRGARAAALASRLRELSTLYVPDRLHAVRLAAKKLRYTLELERTVRRSAATADLRTLEAIQERLGELHDLQVLLDRLREVKRHAGLSRTVIAELPCMRMDIERECRSQHAQVVSRIPVWLRLAERRAGH